MFTPPPVTVTVPPVWFMVPVPPQSPTCSAGSREPPGPPLMFSAPPDIVMVPLPPVPDPTE